MSQMPSGEVKSDIPEMKFSSIDKRHVIVTIERLPKELRCCFSNPARRSIRDLPE